MPDAPEAYGLEGFAADLTAVIARCAGPVVLVGWSMGVLVSLTFLAAQGSDRLCGLVLASGTACPGSQAQWFRGSDAASIAEEARARAERLSLKAYAQPQAVAGAWMAARRADLRPMLSQVNVPTLVVHGSADDQCPLSHGEAMAAGIPGADLLVWPDGGHNLMAEDPAGIAAALVGFIGKALAEPSQAQLHPASRPAPLDGSRSF